MTAPVVASHATAHVINTSGDVTVTKPTGVDGSDGEWLFAYYLTAGQGSAQTHTPPSGFTLIDSQTETYFSGPGRGSIYRKKTGGSEPANYTFDSGVASDTYGVVLMWRVTGCDDTTPVDANAYVNTTAPASDYVFPSVTTTGADRLILICGGLANNPTGTQWPDAVPTGFTRQAWINDTGEFVNVGSASKTQASAGASGTFTVPFNDMDDMSQGFTIAISPATVAYTLTAASGSYALTGTTAALAFGGRLAAESGSYALSGTAVTLTYAGASTYTLTAESGSYAVTGTTVSLRVDRNIAAEAGSYSLTGTAASLRQARVLAAEAGAYGVTGSSASLLSAKKLVAATASYSLTGTAVALAYGKALAAESGSYALTGTSVAFGRIYAMAAASGSYVMTGTSVTLSRGGARITVTPISTRATVAITAALAATGDVTPITTRTQVGIA